MKFFFEIFLNPLDCDKQNDAYVLLTVIHFIIPLIIAFIYYIVLYKWLNWNSERKFYYNIFFLLNLSIALLVSGVALTLIPCQPSLIWTSIASFSFVNMFWACIWYFLISLLMKRFSKNAFDMPI